MQITGGLSYLTPLPNNAWVQIIVIIVVTVLFILSAARGIDKGIKVLSNVNMIIAGILLLFILAIGPTLFIAEYFVTILGGYIYYVIPMILTLSPYFEISWFDRSHIIIYS